MFTEETKVEGPEETEGLEETEVTEGGEVSAAGGRVVGVDHAAIRGVVGPGLVLVATPIGNLGDISARAIAELVLADAIACEDTRHTRKLLSALCISGKRLLAVHEHNERAAADGLISLIQNGERVVLVSDAGTPGLSDPGEVIAAAVALAGLPVTAIPGASALLPALTISGLPTGRFMFEGFLPRSGSERS
jgi:16S rRNA (cytidine1402-2'-O)-methyltransferase